MFQSVPCYILICSTTCFHGRNNVSVSSTNHCHVAFSELPITITQALLQTLHTEYERFIALGAASATEHGRKGRE